MTSLLSFLHGHPCIVRPAHYNFVLVQLLVSDLDGPSLAALILQEAEEGGGEDTEDNDVACRIHIRFDVSSVAMYG